ncbi:MAG: EscF/YscF/HrpA family type III secretion system needle major subunit [Pirellulales bacterium]|nr:EscF/YscF/HrpA family type III secretion system needle major subunit [Pirellulales bacterium]
MNGLRDQVGSGIDSIGGEIQSQMGQIASGQNLSEQDMLSLQYAMNRWNILVSMETNIQKTWADTIKNIVRNLS